MRMIGSSHLATFLGWIRHIPEEIIFTRAYLCVECGWALILAQQLEQAEKSTV